MGNPERPKSTTEKIKQHAVPAIGAFLAGYLAAQLPEPPQNNATVMQPQRSISQMYERESRGPDLPGPFDAAPADSGGTSSFEFTTTPEAQRVINGLSMKLGPQFPVGIEVKEVVREAITDYLKNNPQQQGRMEQIRPGEIDAYSSIDPRQDLFGATLLTDMNPAVRGIIQDELSEQIQRGLH